MTDILLHTQCLTKNYHVTRALDAFDIDIYQSEFVALLGGNGAGKTTLLRLLLGLIPHDPPPGGGSSMMVGCINGRLSVEAKQRIGYISDEAEPVAWASISDSAALYATIYAGWNWNRFRELCAHWKLDTGKKMKNCSKGQKRLAGFALVLACNPEILVLDEPFNGLDAVNRIELQVLLKRMNAEQGTTILYTTHVLEEVDRLARRLVIIREGRKVADTQIALLGEPVISFFCRMYGIDFPQGEVHT